LTSCGESAQPGDSRTQFSRARDDQALVFVQVQGVEPDRDYELTVRWFAPDGGLVGRVSQTVRAPARFPPASSIRFYPFMTLQNRALGRWRVQIAINGQDEGERSFKVVD
jgi:hypothetical protein